MKKIIYLLALIPLLNSCGVFKKNISKTKNKEQTVTETKTAQTFTSAATRTITETVQTDIEVKKDSLTTTGGQDELDAGAVIKSENANLVIETWKDPKTKKIISRATRKQLIIPVSVNKKTIEAINQGATFTQDKKAATKKSSESKNVNTSARTGVGVYIIWFLLILLALFICWRIGKRYKIW